MARLATLLLVLLACLPAAAQAAPYSSHSQLYACCTDAETKEVCTQTYDIDFPLFSKVDVNGSAAHPLWRWMCTQKAGVIGGRIAWNFTKFLIDGEGKVLRRYAPPVPPSRIARRIESELGLRA